MPVWQKAERAMVEVYRLADKLPDYEKYSMAKQLRDAALSIPGNIAEAFGRHYPKDKSNFYYFSRGSAFECISHLMCAVSVDHFTTPEIENAVSCCNIVIEDLNKIIKTLGNM
jgi:four helix bundle protein